MKKIEYSDFMAVKYPSALCVSPKGESCAWLVHGADYDNNRYSAELWMAKLPEGVEKAVKTEKEPKSPVWLSETEVAYCCPAEGGTELRVVTVDGGERSLGTVGKKFGKFWPLPDGSFMILATEQIKTVPNEIYSEFDEIPFRWNGAGYTNGRRAVLERWYPASEKVEPVSQMDAEVVLVSVSGMEVLYTIRYRIDKKMKFAALRRYDAETGRDDELVPPDIWDFFHVQRLGDSIMANATNMNIYGNVENPNFYMVRDGGLKLVAAPDMGVTDDVTSDSRFGACSQYAVDGGYMYFISTDHMDTHLYRIGSCGKIEQLTAGEGTVDGIAAAGGNLVAVMMRDCRAPEIYIIKDGTERRVSHINDAFFDSTAVSRPHMFTFKDADGVDIDGCVILPPDFDESKKYPGLLEVHGGPKLAYGTVYHHEMQMLAAAGYIVFFCNPRGSDGKGNVFMDQRSLYSVTDYSDLMDFTDEVLRRCPQIDAERLGVLGGSYGGYMTNWIIGHTDRFKAAVPQRCISNLISQFCEADKAYRFTADQYEATPWTDPEKLWLMSPLRYADRVKTPTLFIHSDEDYICPMSEGLQMFTALRYNGVETKLCLFHGENHELSRAGRPKQRRKRLEEIKAWMDDHLMA